MVEATVPANSEGTETGDTFSLHIQELRAKHHEGWGFILLAPGKMKTHCKKSGCKFIPWRGSLCYTHFRESQGFVFDPVRKIFIAKEIVKSK